MNCDSWLEPKNSLIAAATGFALIMSCGIKPSLSASDSRSFTARSTRIRPTRNWFSAISPTERTRRLPRWSISSTVPLPLRMSISVRSTSMMSSRVQHARADDLFAAETTVELHAADLRQVVALRGEEQIVEQVLCGFLRRRLSRTHHAIDLHQRFQPVARRDRCAACRTRTDRSRVRWCRSSRSSIHRLRATCSDISSVMIALHGIRISPVS